MVNVPLLTSLQILIPPNTRARVMTIFGLKELTFSYASQNEFPFSM